MVDSPTTRNRFRKQETGTNNNTWGTNLNQVLDCIDQTLDGVEPIALSSSSDYTLTTTNYTTADEAKNRVLYFTGTLTSAVNVIIPSVEHQYTVKNATGVALTVKTSAGTGIAIPNGRQCDVFCDASNVLAGSANHISHYAATLVNAGDVVVKTTLETAIAAASIPAATGTVFNSAADTTPGYLSQKIAVAGDLALTTQSPGADEDALITHTPYWATPRNITNSSSPVTAVNRDILLCQTSTGAITVNLPASGRVQIVDVSGSAATNNITVHPPTGDSIMDGAANDQMLVDLAWFSCELVRRPSGTNWSVD